MGGSSSQPRTYPPRSPINAFLIKELYTPRFSESLQENTSYWQAPNTYEAAGEQVATSSTKNMKKATHNRQKRMIENNDAPRNTPWTTEEEVALAKGWLAVYENCKDGNAKKKQGFWWEESGAGAEDYVQKAMIHWSGGSKRHKSSGSSSFNTESGEASINLNTNVGDNNEDEVQKIRRPEGRDKARAAWRKNKRSKPTRSSTLNEDEIARVDGNWDDSSGEEERLAFLEIKRRDVECREQEIEQQDMRLDGVVQFSPHPLPFTVVSDIPMEASHARVGLATVNHSSWSPINAFLIEELYTPRFSKSLQENTSYWQAPNTYEAASEQVATSSTKNMKKATHNRQKRMIENNDAPRNTPWTKEEEVALAKGWLAVYETARMVT
nr:hypothetical protein [Tanacetum cinerariifolium]